MMMYEKMECTEKKKGGGVNKKRKMSVIYLKDSEDLETLRTNTRTYILNNDGTALDAIVDYAEGLTGDRSVASTIVRELIDAMKEEELIVEIG